MHTIPCIRDGELVLTESRAIMIYLIEKYVKKTHTYLYPTDIVEKAKVHQMLHFDLGSFYKAFMDIAVRIQNN
jgi:glutathione S-transferase